MNNAGKNINLYTYIFYVIWRNEVLFVSSSLDLVLVV